MVNVGDVWDGVPAPAIHPIYWNACHAWMGSICPAMYAADAHMDAVLVIPKVHVQAVCRAIHSILLHPRVRGPVWIHVLRASQPPA